MTLTKQQCKDLLPVKGLPLESQSELTLLGMVIWGEARGEPDAGKYAVGYTVINRWKQQSWYGKSISTVITFPWQFSCMNPKTPALKKMMNLKNIPSWQKCIRIAHEIYTNESIAHDYIMKRATHFHSVNISPRWTKAMRRLGRIGNHVFYEE